MLLVARAVCCWFSCAEVSASTLGWADRLHAARTSFYFFTILKELSQRCTVLGEKKNPYWERRIQLPQEIHRRLAELLAAFRYLDAELLSNALPCVKEPTRPSEGSRACRASGLQELSGFG